MKKRLRNLFLICICLVTFNASATHIVGGDFYYNQLGSTKFEIVLELYLDCYNGNPTAIQMDQVAIIGIFDAATGSYLDTIEVSRTPPKRVSVANYVCALPPSNECINQYTYRKTITMFPGNNGLILAFQRCCRNHTISNIYNPDATGATYWMTIPGTKTVSWNNSARFKQLPPNYLCTNEELIWDHSAVDPDGDSLAYELYQPYQGASQAVPRPNRPSNPPFEKVYWRSGYSTFNQMAGNPILTIDRKTGQLHVTPNKIGQFVVGIKVLEFRDGKLIHETLRDYQMNVYKCEPVITSAFFKRTYECSDTVKFVNMSRNATKYEWYFGDPEDPSSWSTERNPTHIYPGNGKYSVILIAKDDRNCTDTFENDIDILSEINIDIGPDTTVCGDFEVILEADYPDATSIWWSNGKLGPRVSATDTGIQSVKVYYASCFGTDTLYIHSDQMTLTLPDDSLYCDVVNGTLDAGLDNVRYFWSTSPADTFRYLDVDQPGMYSLTVINKTGCMDTDSIYLFTGQKPVIGPFLFVCNEFNRKLDAGDIPEATYLWDNGVTSRYRTINREGKYWVQVTQRHCVSADTLSVINPIIPLDLGEDSIHCDSFNVTLSGPDDMARYMWNNEATSQSIRVQQPGTYILEVTDTNGCIRIDSILLQTTPSPIIDLGGDTSICVRSEIMVGIDEPFVKYVWNTDEYTRKIRVSREGLYILTVTDEYYCSGKDSIFVYEDPNALPNDLFVPNAFTPNGDGLNDLFPFTGLVDQREFQLLIYNRWGEKIFDSELNNSQHWDAEFQSESVSQDAYVYLIRYRGCDGDLRHLKGTVTVLR